MASDTAGLIKGLESLSHENLPRSMTFQRVGTRGLQVLYAVKDSIELMEYIKDIYDLDGLIRINDVLFST